ncbi:DHHW family protein [Cohnella faecalis]|uniref:AlgX/AlgJ SGNH hydrolase-like domain-containing protein n=1 Tax=Cohnella faecalis TaxID=2315694 RepID=A0A398CJ88_9BACL|nr:DHHW family protein [Cohnella faecalis]RIE02380.1 hypothetical protein D3H35_16840 [Cohnella faecalis]
MSSSNHHKWNIALFLIPIAAMAVLNLTKPGGSSDISTLEQREVQAWPAFSMDKLVHGKLFKEYDNYFSDRFVFRNTFVELGSSAKELKGLKGDDVSIVVQKGDTGEQMSGGGASAVQLDDSGQLMTGKSSSKYLVVKDSAMLLYHYSPVASEAYAKAINHLDSLVDSSVNVYSMLVPSQVEFVESEKLRKLSDSQKKAFEHVYSLLGDGVKPVPAYDSVAAHKNEYVYFRTDHHWTALGAYYAYEAVAKTMGFAPVPIGAYEKKEMPGYLGTSYAATLSAALKNHPDTITAYVPAVKNEYKVFKDGKNGKKRELVEGKIPKDGRGGYAVFLGGDFAMSRISTDVGNGKKLLVVKDSYANALIPFLLSHFEEIELVDPRYFKGNLVAEIKERGITDVLFVNGPVVTTYTGIAKLVEERLAAG